MKIIIKIWRAINCMMGMHEWTSKSMEGEKPDPEKMKEDIEGYFWEYARVYCKHCGKESKFNRR